MVKTFSAPPTMVQPEEPRSDRRRLALRIAAGVVGLVLVCGCVAAAASTVFAPRPPLPPEASFTLATAKQGTVGASLELTAVASWAIEPVGRNAAAGTVTTVTVTAGQEVHPGDILYTVNLRPTVIAEGEVPAFQPIGPDSKGEDVAQLQRLLTARGEYTGPADGKVGSNTIQAIRSWQKSLGETPTGVVELGDVVFVPHLPTRVSLDPAVIQRGAIVSGGENAINGLSSTPSFTIPISDNQSALIPSGATVEITAPKGGERWVGIAGKQDTDSQTGTIKVEITSKNNDTPICANACASIPASGETRLSARIVTIPETTGIVVPTASLRTSADGSVDILDAHGKSISVQVVATAKGMSVVKGLTAGTKVRISTGGESK